VAGSVGAFVLLHAMLRSWSGDWGWGPRYLVTITPWMMVPAMWTVMAAREDRSRRLLRYVLRATVALSLVVQLAALVINWHYRYAYLVHTHRLGPQVIWTVTGSQLTDALTAAWRNLQRVAGRALPLDIVPSADPINVRASNTLNLWWVTAVAAGVPWPQVAVIVLVLASTGAAAWRAHRRATQVADRA
jgi:hypothetical protein